MTHSAETVHAVHHNTKHGRFGTKIYQTWTSMLDRCRNPRHQAWHNYGGRGITVDPRWARSFSEFLVDMGEKPEGMTLDRIDPNGGYTKGNCRWATWREQSLNKRNTRRYEAFGQKKTAKEWAEDPIGANRPEHHQAACDKSRRQEHAVGMRLDPVPGDRAASQGLHAHVAGQEGEGVRPCPFCRATGLINPYRESSPGSLAIEQAPDKTYMNNGVASTISGNWMVTCSKCLACGPSGTEPQEALWAWELARRPKPMQKTSKKETGYNASA